jgi:type IV secretion system protein TrbL
MEPGILDTILDEFQGALNTAIPFLQGDVGFLFQTFLIITIIMAGVAYAFGDNSTGMHFLLKKVLLIGFSLFLIQNWLDLTNVVVNSFGILGLRAGGIAGVTLTTADFFFPSRIIDLGFSIAEQIFDQINVAGSFFRFNLGDLAVGLLAGLTMGLAFIIIALQVFMALIEFKIVTLGGFLLLPFAILDRTTSIAERALG